MAYGLNGDASGRNWAGYGGRNGRDNGGRRRQQIMPGRHGRLADWTGCPICRIRAVVQWRWGIQPARCDGVNPLQPVQVDLQGKALKKEGGQNQKDKRRTKGLTPTR